MHQFLRSSKTFGSFEFFSHIVMLYQQKSRDLSNISASLTDSDVLTIDQYERRARIRSLIRHELTHFLDMTTTRWGLEYQFRKLQLVDGLLHQNDVQRRMDVFMLNTTEVELHHKLLKYEPAILPSECDVLHNRVDYSARYGAVMTLIFSRANRLVHTVPISVLSVLEAHATSNEYLSQLYDVAKILDAEEQLVARRSIERDFREAIDESKHLEYSALIHLCKLHFEELSLEELLELVAVLARFSLDAGDMLMSAYANIIVRNIQSPYGVVIAADLRRGMSRPVLFLKTVQLMKGWMECLEESDCTAFVMRLRNEPRDALRHFFEKILGIDESFFDFEFEIPERIKCLAQFNALPDAEVAQASTVHNRKILQRKSLASLNFSELILPDLVLADDSVVEFPNRIPVNVKDRYYADMETYLQLDEAYRSQDEAKFHMDPDNALAMELTHRRTVSD
ncbi:hypothetical protein [Janthinobacterium sp. 64]|uniref:hypothetical protein n=1 Tax=Janthinobacterium sp. 64 TaxID=2035208 RepID=UPI000C2CDEA3|nr:hypothetical protein [Janthinobacterium sp. 64]PKB13818.1 hypothetical protein CLU91_5438 [Janthinobacterium sp. 64]